jgi:hypothetical protein
MLLWASAVSVYALVMFLLMRGQIEALRAWEQAAVADALRAGNVKQAAMYRPDDLVQLYPISVVTQFALLGLAVVATAWLGRKAIAVALPTVVMLTSFAPAYWGGGGLAPQPLGQDDVNVWAWLVSEPGVDNYAQLPVWPLVLGSVVQVTLLVLPLIAAPAVKPLLTGAHVAARAALPALALAVLALALVPAPSASELYRGPVVAVALALIVTALATGHGHPAVRIALSVVIPSVVASIVLSSALARADDGLAIASATATASVIVLLMTTGITRLRAHTSSDEGAEFVAAG